MKPLAVLIAALMFAGAGCVPVLPVQSPEKTAGGIDATVGMRLTVSESVFGIGGSILEPFGQASKRTVTLDAWDGEKARVSWAKTFERETEASRKAREEFEKLPPTPVGQPANVPPKTETESVTVTGTAATDALADGDTLSLPATWTEGEMKAEKGRTLIWLSKEQYKQLAETRKAKVNLGLFDSEISGAMSAVQGFRDFLDWASHKAADPAQKQPLDVMDADENWGSYTVNVDGVPETVRTIEAGNAFARISVLANLDDPLVLQVRLTPAAYGPDALIAPAQTFAKALGYEITDIHTR